MEKSFLQTKEWLKFQESVGHKTFRFDDGSIVANVIRHDLPFGKNYLYIPHGPSIDLTEIKVGLKNEIKNFIGQITALAKENNSIFVKFEPLEDSTAELLYRRGFKYSSKVIQPHKTVIISLEKPEEELLSAMHHKTRYNINLSLKKGMMVEESDDLDVFWDLLKKTAKHDNFHTHSKSYYEKLLAFFSGPKFIRTKLFLVKKDGKAIGGAIFLFYDNKVYYLHGATDREHRSLMIPYFLHWELIKSFKAQDFKYYDFYGIDAKRWPGVTKFKLGWGGRTVEYPGSFDLSISKFWYLVYRVARKIF